MRALNNDRTFNKQRPEWLQSNNWSLTALPLGLNFFLVNGEIADMFPNSYIKVPYIFTMIVFMAEFTLEFINDNKLLFKRYQVL